MRSARGGDICALSSVGCEVTPYAIRASAAARESRTHSPWSRETQTLMIVDRGGALERRASTRFGEQRQLSWRRFLPGLVGKRGRIVAGKAMVGELRAQRIALLVTHGTINTFDRQEREGVGADEGAHAFEIVRRRQQLVALR